MEDNGHQVSVLQVTTAPPLPLTAQTPGWQGQEGRGGGVGHRREMHNLSVYAGRWRRREVGAGLWVPPHPPQGSGDQSGALCQGGGLVCLCLCRGCFVVVLGGWVWSILDVWCLWCGFVFRECKRTMISGLAVSKTKSWLFQADLKGLPGGGGPWGFSLSGLPIPATAFLRARAPHTLFGQCPLVWV